MVPLKGAVIDFHLESKSATTKSFFASRATTSRYFTKEALYAALTYKERLFRERGTPYEPTQVPFGLTPAIPIGIDIKRILYHVEPTSERKFFVEYGSQEFIMPGSRFRFLMWDSFLKVEENQPFFIGKKRGRAVVDSVKVVETSIVNEVAGELFPIQLSWEEFREKRGKMRTLNVKEATARYVIFTAVTNEMLKLDQYVLPFFG